MRRLVRVLPLLLGACASVEEHRDAALQSARDDFAARSGVEAPSREDHGEARVAAALDALLAGELDESTAIRVALLNNRDVRAAYGRLGIGAADLVQAGLLHNPVFGVEALFFLDGGTEVDLGLAQPFVDLFWRPLRQRAAEHELAAVGAAVTHDLVHLVYSVRREFVRIRAAQQLVAMQRRAVDAATASHELMRELYAAGNVTAQLLSAERIGEARARLELAAAERAAREAREPLNRLLGLWGPHVAWRIGGELPEDGAAAIDLGRIEGRSVAASLDLIESRARIDAGAQRAGLASWKGWLPDGSLGVSGMREAGDEWAVGPALELELPIFDRGQAKVAAAEAALRMQLDRHVQIAVEVRAAARLLRDRLEMLTQRARFLRVELVPAQQQLLHETLQNYNAMQIGVFQVLAQKQQQLAAVREHLATLRDCWLARIDLEELLAGSIPPDASSTYWPGAGAAAAEPDRGGH
ncbi:MAG: TolC family protein [Planctomycetes bacterium]|nr:TolC family protein [Planctomycetota bacterium]